MSAYLKPGLAGPVASPDGLDAPFWQGLREERLLLQRCGACKRCQWGPEWICHRCLSFDLRWEQTQPTRRHLQLRARLASGPSGAEGSGPLLVVLVELPHADNVRLVGNLLGDPRAPVEIGATVTRRVRTPRRRRPAVTLLQWTRAN